MKPESACGSKEVDLPLSRFPLRGQAGAGKVPPTPRHVSRQQTALARSVRRLPPQEGLPPLPGASPARTPMPERMQTRPCRDGPDKVKLSLVLTSLSRLAGFPG